MNTKGNRHTKRITTRSHYQASVLLYELEKGIIPEWVTWEIKPEHIELLKMFIVDGMNCHEISRTGKIISKRGKPMSDDMIRYWVFRYLPFIEYDEKIDPAPRRRDSEDLKKYNEAKKLIPKDKCAICGSTKGLELDHIVPYYEGGRSDIDNLQWLCHDCHKKKTEIEQRKFDWH